MKNLKNIYVRFLSASIALAALALPTACREDLFEGTQRVPAGYGEAGIPYTVDGELPETRAGIVASGHEVVLNDCFVLFFDAESDALVAAQSVGVQQGTGRVFLNLTGVLEESRKYRTLLVGNPDTFLPEGETDFGQYVNRLKAETGADWNSFPTLLTMGCPAQSGGISPVTDSAGCLPLFGRMVDADWKETLFSYVKDATTGEPLVQGQFFFSRAVCRLDLLNLAVGSLDIRYVKVCNYHKHGYPLADGLGLPDSDVEPGVAGITSDDLMADGDGGYRAVPKLEEDAVSQYIRRKFYAYPNFVGNSAPNDSRTTALMVAGYYGEAAEDGSRHWDDRLSFYRLNITNTGSGQALRRNTCYRITVRGVKERGADSESDAYARGIPVLECSLDDEWDINENNTVSDRDGNFLIVSKTQLTFPGNPAESSGEIIKVTCSERIQWSARLVYDREDASPAGTFKAEALTVTDAPVSDVRDSNGKLVNPYNAVALSAPNLNSGNAARFGYLLVEGRNIDDPYRDPLAIRVGLMQLSASSTTVMLTVNGQTGDSLNPVEQQFPGEGATMQLKVITGDANVAWKCEDLDNEWTVMDTSTFTPFGGNGSMLSITLTPNMTTGAARATRQATLKVSVDESSVPIGTEVPKPVYLRVVQDPATHILFVTPTEGTNVNAEGHVVLNPFDTSAGYPNGIATNADGSVSFKVDILNEDYRYKVITTFDRNMEGFVSTTPHTSHSAVKARMSTNAADATDPGLENMEDGTRFYFHAFRTGPNDPPMRGTILVTAYNPADASAPQQSVAVAVDLVTPKSIIGDVFGKSGGLTFMFPDRNLGSLLAKSQGEAVNFSMNHALKIPGKVKSEYTLGLDFEGAKFARTLSPNAVIDYTPAISSFVAENNGYNVFYNSADISHWHSNKWSFANYLEVLNSIGRFSKQRLFLISDFKRASDGMAVCCWWPDMGTTCVSNMTNSDYKFVKNGSFMYDSYVYHYQKGASENRYRVRVLDFDYVNGKITMYTPDISASDWGAAWSSCGTFSNCFFRPMRETTEAEITAFKNSGYTER